MASTDLQFPASSQPGIVQRLNRYFEDSLFKNGTPVTREELLELLTVQIHRLLHQSPERLTQALYRIDVREEKVSAAFELRESGAIARKLAELAVEREEEKAAFRERFSQPPQP